MHFTKKSILNKIPIFIVTSAANVYIRIRLCSRIYFYNRNIIPDSENKMAEKRNTLIPMVTLKRMKKSKQQQKFNPNHSFHCNSNSFQQNVERLMHYLFTQSHSSSYLFNIVEDTFLCFMFFSRVKVEYIKDIEIFRLRMNFPT